MHRPDPEQFTSSPPGGRHRRRPDSQGSVPCEHRTLGCHPHPRLGWDGSPERGRGCLDSLRCGSGGHVGYPVKTCTSDLSRNRQVGLEVAKRVRLDSLPAHLRALAKGVKTCRSAAALAERHASEMPTCRAVHRVLFEGQDPWEAIASARVHGATKPPGGRRRAAARQGRSD